MSNFSSTITVPQSRPEESQALWEQLIQDGFNGDELRVPPIGTDQFVELQQDAQKFSHEVGGCTPAAWPLRCERWLNRISVVITGKLFSELPTWKRQAITHAAITLAKRPDLLP